MSLYSLQPHTAPSLPPPPHCATDEYSSLQHNLGGGGPQQHQVVDQDQHVYDSAQGDLPQYSTIAQQVSTAMLPTISALHNN